MNSTIIKPKNLIEDKSKLPFPISNKLYRFILRNKQKILEEDTLIVGILWGRVGSGKSVIAHKIAHIISGDKVTLEKIAFSKDEFIKAVLMSRKECIVGDEGISIFFSRGAMTKEGRLMAELMGQCRQKNLMILICIPDVLTVDSMILSMSNFIGHVWESRKLINGRMVTIKGNMRLYPDFKKTSFKNKMIQFLRIKKGNPLIKVKQPHAWLTEPGQPYGDTFKGAFYCVDENLYKEKKESILNKYRKSLERKTVINRQVDFLTMDKLIKARMPNKKIAEFLTCSLSTIDARKKKLKQLGHKVLAAPRKRGKDIKPRRKLRK